MILTDGVRLVSTEGEQELHLFAQRIGLLRRWYQQHKKFPHYGLTTTAVRDFALASGAERVSREELALRAWWWSRVPPATRARLKKEVDEQRVTRAERGA